MRKIILASTSPRRREILEGTGIPFKIEAPGFEEDMKQKLSPRELVGQLALGKALAVAARHKNAIIIAADTVAALGSKMWSKPENKKEARAILSLLSGKTHDVWTGFCIIDTKTGKRIVRVVRTRHKFRTLTPREIALYAARSESLAGAGAYQMKINGHVLSERIIGDFNNIIGLPLAAVLKELAKFGVRP